MGGCHRCHLLCYWRHCYLIASIHFVVKEEHVSKLDTQPIRTALIWLMLFITLEANHLRRPVLLRLF